MIRKNIFEVSSDEIKRILSMHQKATENHYLLREFPDPKSKVEPKTNTKEFQLPTDLFNKGKYQINNLDGLKSAVEEVKNYLSNFPKNQKIKLEVQGSESKVPQKKLGFDEGELSGLRVSATIDKIKRLNILPPNVEIVPKNLGAQGPPWSGKISEVDTPKYKNWQYVKFVVVASGQIAEPENITPTVSPEPSGKKIPPEECNLDFYVDMYYKRDWCKSEGICHACDDAMFIVYANGVPLYNQNTKKYFCSLNNASGGDEHAGPDVGCRMVIDNNIKQEAFKINPNELMISIGCHSYICHGDAAGFKVYNSVGTLLMDEEKFSIGQGRKPKNELPNKNIIKLNKCGELIENYDARKVDESWESRKFLQSRGAQESNLNKDRDFLILWAKYLKDGKFVFPYQGLWYGTTTGSKTRQNPPNDWIDVQTSRELKVGENYGI